MPQGASVTAAALGAAVTESSGAHIYLLLHDQCTFVDGLSPSDHICLLSKEPSIKVNAAVLQQPS